jgi:hypothetical protein
LPKNMDAIAFEYALFVLCNVSVSIPLPYAFEALVPLNFTSSVPVTVKFDPLNVKLEFPKIDVLSDATVNTLPNPVLPVILTEPPPPAPAGPVTPCGPVAPYPGGPVGPVPPVLIGPVGPVGPVVPVDPAPVGPVGPV